MSAVARNHLGYRVGECHQHANASDSLVREIRERNTRGEGYIRLSRDTGIPVSTIRDFCTFRTRASA